MIWSCRVPSGPRGTGDLDFFTRSGADAGVPIDLAVTAPPDLPVSATRPGPRSRSAAPEELVGHKLLALADGVT